MRKVKVFHYVETSGGNSSTPRSQLKWERVEDYVGVFHQWGCEYDEYETGPGNYTVALIESEDGNIKGVTPNLIQFID